MRILTWNINSLRLRLGLLAQVADVLRPDVVCLQETKVPDDLFPLGAVTALGFQHVAFKGMKGYNGVAILSRFPLERVQTHIRCGKDDCRHISAHVAGVELHNLYIPAGGDVPDPDFNDKFAHKLNFLTELTELFQASNPKQTPMILAGDLNIAPLPNDVWSHKQLLGVVSHTPVEVDLLTGLQETLRWVDGVRRFVPPEEKLFSWWSYRSSDWSRNDRGRRLDHIWVTPSLEPNLRGALIARECRDWTQPSDHVPVMLDLEPI